MNALANSVESPAQNWMQEKATKSEKKITHAETSIIAVRATFGAVQSTAPAPYPNTTTAWVIRPSRRIANLSAHTWTSSGTGRVSIESSVPLRT